MTFMETYPGIREAIRDSGVTILQLQDIYDEVISLYDEWAEPLPDMAWKKSKPAHARKCQKLAREFSNILGFNALEIAYFGMLFAAHDLGRMVQAVLKSTVTLDGVFLKRWTEVFGVDRPVPYPDAFHGQDSAQLLRPVLGSLANTTIGRWSLDAVVMHSFVDNPTLANAGGNTDLLALANVLRDLDKVEGFRSAKKYTADAEFRAKQRLQNWPDQVKVDPEWGLELGRIDPEEFLGLFEQEQALDRKKCRSYETYMLQYLAWIFSIVQTEMQDIALKEGGPQVVAAYLLKQLEASPAQRARLLVKLERWVGGILLM